VPEVIYDYPDRDLMTSLFNLYFKQVNVFYPLLHRPTFERAVAEDLHLRDALFGSTVLLVCAVGSLYSDDPRVFLEGTDSAHSCGWKWFTQVEIVKKSLLAPPSLYDLQFLSVRRNTSYSLSGSHTFAALGYVLRTVICASSVLDNGGHRNSLSTRRRRTPAQSVQSPSDR
jgi:hypothetical protein